jgi:fatty acid desaturase
MLGHNDAGIGAVTSKLAPEDFRRLTKKSPWPWLRDAAVDWSVIVAAMALARAWNNPLGYLLAVLVIGNRQHALAILGHDGTHFAAANAKRLNDIMTDVLAFWPIGLTATGYRNLHFRHHKFLNTPEDPELQHRSAKAPQWDLPVTLKRVLTFAAWDMIGYSLTDYLIIVSFSKPEKKREYWLQGAFHLVVAGAACAAGLWWACLLWYAALPTAFMMFFRLRTWLEHQGSEDTHVLHLTLLERLVLSPHYAWHHYEHHHWPSVPYYHLPALRRALKPARVLRLSELIRFYDAAPALRSGQALKPVIATPEKTSPIKDSSGEAIPLAA